MSALDDAARRYPCPRCGQPGGEPCITRTGRPARDDHQARSAPVADGWRIGVADGKRYALVIAHDSGALIPKRLPWAFRRLLDGETS